MRIAANATPENIKAAQQQALVDQQGSGSSRAQVGPVPQVQPPAPNVGVQSFNQPMVNQQAGQPAQPQGINPFNDPQQQRARADAQAQQRMQDAQLSRVGEQGYGPQQPTQWGQQAQPQGMAVQPPVNPVSGGYDPNNPQWAQWKAQSDAAGNVARTMEVRPGDGQGNQTGLDQSAIQADPSGYAAWQKQAAQAGYNYDGQGNQTGAVGPVPGATVNPITQQNTSAWSSITPQQTPQEAQLQQYQMQLAGQAANTPKYDYSGIGSKLTSGAESAMLGALGSFGQVAAPNIQSVSGGSASSESNALRQALMQRSGALDGPDRSQLANQAFQLLQDESRPAYEQELRGVGQKAAALGRVGAGMTTNDLTGVQQSRDRMLSQAQRGMSIDAAGQTLQDRLAALSGTGQAFSTLDSADQGWGGLGLQAGMANNSAELAKAQFGLNKAQGLAGLAQGAFGLGAGMRGEQFGYDNARFNAGLQGLGAVSGVGGQLYGQNAGFRNELRVERANEQGLDAQAQQDMIQQMMMEEQFTNSQFNRNADEFNTLGNFGYNQSDPTRQMNYQAGVDQGQADQGFDGAADLMGQYFAGQVGGQGAPMQPGVARNVLGPNRPNVTSAPPAYNPNQQLPATKMPWER